MDNEARRQVVTRYLNAAAKRDFTAMTELLTEDFTFWMVMSAKERGMPYPLVGREAFFTFVRDLERTSTKWKVETSTPLQMFEAGITDFRCVFNVPKDPAAAEDFFRPWVAAFRAATA